MQPNEDPRIEDVIRALISWLENCEQSKAADWAMVVLTVAVASAAFWSANIFQGQLTEARKATSLASDSFRIDERAWIVLDPIKPTFLAAADDKFPAAYSCDLYLRNVGKTVATDIEVKADSPGSFEGFGDHADWIANNQDKYLLNQYKESGTGKPVIIPKNPVPKVLAPNSISPVPFRLACASPKTYPDAHQFMQYMIGRVDYCDQFRIKHWLKFCFYVVNARGEVWACQNGNDQDKNSESPTPRTSCGSP